MAKKKAAKKTAKKTPAPAPVEAPAMPAQPQQDVGDEAGPVNAGRAMQIDAR